MESLTFVLNLVLRIKIDVAPSDSISSGDSMLLVGVVIAALVLTAVIAIPAAVYCYCRSRRYVCSELGMFLVILCEIRCKA